MSIDTSFNTSDVNFNTLANQALNGADSTQRTESIQKLNNYILKNIPKLDYSNLTKLNTLVNKKIDSYTHQDYKKESTQLKALYGVLQKYLAIELKLNDYMNRSGLTGKQFDENKVHDLDKELNEMKKYFGTLKVPLTSEIIQELEGKLLDRIHIVGEKIAEKKGVDGGDVSSLPLRELENHQKNLKSLEADVAKVFKEQQVKFDLITTRERHGPILHENLLNELFSEAQSVQLDEHVKKEMEKDLIKMRDAVKDKGNSPAKLENQANSFILKFSDEIEKLYTSSDEAILKLRDDLVRLLSRG